MHLFKSEFGYLSDDYKEFIITTPFTPRPWVNVISNGVHGFVISQNGSGYSWRVNAQLNRITRWEQDLIKDNWGKFLYIRDDETGEFWSAGFKPTCREPENYTCKHGLGYTVIESIISQIKSELLLFVPLEDPIEIWRLKLTNLSKRVRKISVFSYFEWCLGVAPDWHREFHKHFIETSFEADLNAIFATKRMWDVPSERGHWNRTWPYIAFHSVSLKPRSFDTDKETFIGLYKSEMAPLALQKGKLAKRTGNMLDPIASLHVSISLKPGESKDLFFTLGTAETKNEAVDLIKTYNLRSNVEKAFDDVRNKWSEIVDDLKIQTPDNALDAMVNVWLKYQSISGRLLGRTAYYQVGGAYGFRDQLQDSLIFLPIDPSQTKNQILLHARHQFRDGSVYHWWHPLTETGLRNEVSDNMLWLPFIVLQYIQETDDLSILYEKIPFVDDENPSTLLEHCIFAINRGLSRLSPRNLPLIGAGDWNDALNAVGLRLKGESIWLGHFLVKILNDFAELLKEIGDEELASKYLEKSVMIKKAVNQYGWDGNWYVRAFKDSGEKIGSNENDEGKIYLNAQTWSVISGVADIHRANYVMDQVEKILEREIGPLLLFPAYKTPDESIGYITRYAPGSRENGGVYTHAAVWCVMAEAILNRNESAYRMLSKILPLNKHKLLKKYFAEPYVTPGNVEGPESPFYGRGGWTWYSGSSAWLFDVTMKWILGIRPTRKGLIVDPHIPSTWREYVVRRKFRGSVYFITVKNKTLTDNRVKEVNIDGEKRNDCITENGFALLPCFCDGKIHEVTVFI